MSNWKMSMPASGLRVAASVMPWSSRDPLGGRAHLTEACPWIRRQFAVDATHVRDLGLREAEDPEIFDKAREAEVVLFTKDEDFVDLVGRLGAPPQVLWLRCGNMSNARLWTVLTLALPDAIKLLRQGEPVVEISLPQGDSGSRPSRSRRRPKAGRA